jgi:propanol-preferring alcohol dehydrogenase
MSEMTAVVLPEWGGELSVESVARPEPGPGEVRVAVRACAVTRTVENAVQGGLSDDPALTPRVPGHEFAGVVDAVGAGVTGVDPGDRVLAYFYLTCGACDACRRGERNRCTEFGGWLGVDRDGAYAEYATVPAANAVPIPDDLGFPAAAIAADGLATPLHVCERTGVGDDDTVLVVGGAGRIGIHLSQLAASRGAHVLAADVHERRLAHVEEVTGPAVTAVDASGPGFPDRVREATPYGDGPTVAVDTVGDVETLEAAWETLAMGGQVVTLTTHHDRAFAPPLKEFVVRETSIVGSRYASPDEVVRAARLFADGRVDPVVRREVGFDAVAATHRELRAGETFGTTLLTPA